MKLFIDTANLDEIRQANDLGILDGVTTNPTHISKEKADLKTRLREICQIVPGPVSAEVVSTETEGMIHEADELVRIAPNIVIKLPTTAAGVRALKNLAGRGIKVNMTLCFQPLQALVVAKVGATYISPFVGRFDDQAEEGMQLVRHIRSIYNNYQFATQILAASLRTPYHLVQAALIGVDVATVPFAVIEKMLFHPLTDIGLTKFLEDWKKVHPNLSI
ncbi:MAG TPA: fructose-6-phosphate aldolase [Tepidisphaeraceae bacterium]|nr:fructose-6-phosphate aldolase [Tepidisphaeraceae bacterium]